MALGAIYASPAAAHPEEEHPGGGAPAGQASTKTVGFNKTDYIFLPERVAVRAGESVKWSNTVSDEPHNVRFEDGQFTEPPFETTSNRFTTSPRTFSAEGTYRYYCEVHGRGNMDGVVYVNPTGTVPPDARFRVSPDPPVAGEVVTFDGAATRAGDNPVAKYEWDLNGDGMFEVNTGANRTTTRTYLAAQDLEAKLKVTDTAGVSEVRTLPVSVGAAPASTADPAPRPGPAAQVAATASRPPSTPQTTTSTGKPPTAQTPGAFSFQGPSTASRVKGAAVEVTCSAGCRVTATLSITKSVARKARLGSRAMTIGSSRGSLTSAGSKTVTVKLTSKARRKLARFASVRATLKLAVVDASGKTTRKQKAVVLKR